MTPDEAIAKWRGIKTLEELDVALTNPEFQDALNLAGKLAWESKDPARRFWEVDATGWRKKQYNVSIPPAKPNDQTRDFIVERMKPIPGCAFPS